MTKVGILDDRVVSLDEAATIAGVSVATLKRCRQRRELTVLQLSPRRIGVRLSHLSTWLKGRANKPAPPKAPHQNGHKEDDTRALEYAAAVCFFDLPDDAPAYLYLLHPDTPRQLSNALIIRGDLKTMGDLRAISDADFLATRSLGHTSLMEFRIAFPKEGQP